MVAGSGPSGVTVAAPLPRYLWLLLLLTWMSTMVHLLVASMLLGPKTHAFLSGVQSTYYMYIGVPGSDKKWPFKKNMKNFYIQWTILNESFRVALICGLEISLFRNFFAALPLKVLRWARDGFARLNTGNAGSELSVCKVPGEAIVNCHDYSTTEQGCAQLCTKASCSTVPRQASTYCYIWLQSVCVCKLEGQPLPIVRLEHAMTKHAISIQQHL